MSNEQNGLSGIENLTPFEYALAGVSPTSNQDSPSLAVVEQMRALAAEVEDAPITQRRLQELMQGNAGAAKRNERRALKRRRATADGGFVDITPAELNEQNRLYAANEGVSGTDVASVAGVAALGGLAAGASQLDDDVAFAETEPTSEQPAINLSDATVQSQSADIDLDSTEPIQLDESGIVADLGDRSDADQDLSQPTGLAEDDFERQFDAIQAAMLESEPAEEPTFYDIPIEAEASDSEASAFSGEFGEQEFSDPELGDTEFGDAKFANADELAEEAVEESGMADEGVAIAGAAALGVSVFDMPSPGDDQLFDRSNDELRDASGRFAGDHLFESEPAAFEAEAALLSEDQDLGTPVLVTAGGEGLLLDDEADDSRNPLAAAALTGNVPPPAIPERRFGGAFWALAGTAAAAAVLALGGLLWANSLNDSNTTESAAATQETDSADDGSSVSADGTSEASTEDGDQDSSTSALAPAPEGEDDRPALAVDGDDAGSQTDPDTTAQTTAPSDGADQTDDPGTTDTAATETTTPGDTDPSESTEAPTIEPEPDGTTTVPQATTLPTTVPPTPDPTPAPTTAPVIRPSFIGDRVTLGGFDGPGIAGVRVRLFSDVDGNGIGEERLAVDDTDNGGFYGFDEFPSGCYQIEFSRLPGGVSLEAEQASRSFCLGEGEQNGRFDAVAVVSPPDNCIVEVSNNFSDRGVEVHENDFDRADSYTFYNQSGGVVFRTSQVGEPDDLDTNPYGDYEWFAEESGFNHRNVHAVAAERLGVESTPITCQRQ